MALGNAEEVSQHRHKPSVLFKKMRPASWFVELHLHYGSFQQVAPRWKSCVLETERGFDVVLRDLLNERTAHKEVISPHGDLGHYELKGLFGLFNVVLYEELIHSQCFYYNRSPLMKMNFASGVWLFHLIQQWFLIRKGCLAAK